MGIPIRAGEQFQLNAVASIAVTLQADLVVDFGRGRPRKLLVGPVTTTNDRDPAEFLQDIEEDGMVLSGTMNVVGGTNADEPGTLYSHLTTISGPNHGVTKIMADYHYGLHQPSYPGPIRGSLEGQGLIRSIAGTNPAAGVEITETVPTNARWRLIAVRLVCAVGAAAFDPSLAIDDGTTQLGFSLPNSSPTGGATETMVWGNGLVSQTVGNTMTAPLPEPSLLSEGYRILTTDITADDDYAAPQLWVEEWLVV